MIKISIKKYILNTANFIMPIILNRQFESFYYKKLPQNN